MKAIDVHSHLSTAAGTPEMSEAELKAVEAYIGFRPGEKTEKEMAQDFIDADVKGLIISHDCEANTGQTVVSNDYVAQMVKDYPEAFLGAWAMIDPWKGKVAIRELERAVKELGLMGLKFQQLIQGFFPNDRQFYPLYEKCVELKVPVMFHTGFGASGAGAPGGGGYHLKYTKPIPYIDDVAADFPDLKVIMAHPGWPWTNELIAVLLHKGNVFSELSGWSPKYYTPELGTDYPGFPHEMMFKAWESEGYKPEVLEKIYFKNAQRILGIGF
jgi:predicted TIM-barrel fold metal-dependent hydrolase